MELHLVRCVGAQLLLLQHIQPMALYNIQPQTVTLFALEERRRRSHVILKNFLQEVSLPHTFGSGGTTEQIKYDPIEFTSDGFTTSYKLVGKVSLEPSFLEIFLKIGEVIEHIQNPADKKDLIPLAIRGLLQRGTRFVVILLGRLFKKICSRVQNLANSDELMKETAEVMCFFEKQFPLSVTTITFHLLYHAVEQVNWCGLVQNRWMDPFERLYKILKQILKNKAVIALCPSHGS